MTQRLYTQGEAISLAGKMMGGFIEIIGMAFFLIIKMLSGICRIFFTGAGLFIDGYNEVRNAGSIRIAPELRDELEKAILLASYESRTWQWLDEAIVPVKQAIAVSQGAFREKTMKRKEIVKKDFEVLVMAVTLKKIVFETMLISEDNNQAVASPEDQDILNSSFIESKKKKMLTKAGHEFKKLLMNLRFITTRCSEAPARKAASLVKLAAVTLKYHQTNRVKYRKKMYRILNSEALNWRCQDV